MLPNQQLNPIFLATVQATEEAVVNAMVAAKTMKGINDYEVIGLPHDRLREVLKKYNRSGEVEPPSRSSILVLGCADLASMPSAAGLLSS